MDWRYCLRKIILKMRIKMGWYGYAIISGDDLVRMLKKNNKNIKIWLWDAKYYVPSFRLMKEFFEFDLVRKQKYRAERFDCDNFAVSFASEVAMEYGFNNVGIVVGAVYERETDKMVGYHAWNVFVAMKDDGSIKMYIYEPQTGEFGSYDYPYLGGWRYESILVIWG